MSSRTPTKKKITIIRHAQSMHNAGQFSAQEEVRNARLSSEGKKQADGLKGSFDLVVLSPLRRAVETYARSGIACRQLKMCDLFREEADGLPANHLELEVTRVETKEEIRQRAKEARKYIEACDSYDIGILSHGIFIWYFLEACGQKGVPTYNVQSITFEL